MIGVMKVSDKRIFEAIFFVPHLKRTDKISKTISDTNIGNSYLISDLLKKKRLCVCSIVS